MFDPPAELKGRINMLKDMNDVINAGLRYLNYPRCNSNKAQLKELNTMLIKAKADWRTMDYSVIEKLTSKGRRPVTELERRRQACAQGPP